MIKFEQVGINIQNECVTIKEAESKFARSCEICCNRGLHIECDRCLIAAAHKLTVSALSEEMVNA